MLSIFERIHLVNLFFACMVLASTYVTVEGLTRLKLLDGEYSRKAIHISLGLLLATLPVFMSRTEVAVFLSLFFLGIISLSIVSEYVERHTWAHRYWIGRFLKDIFTNYEDVNRWTIGQFLYPLSLLLVVFLFDDMTLYSFAVLELALADGFAAIIGKTFAQRIYHIPGGTKSWIGSFAFFCVTVSLVSVYVVLVGAFSPLMIIFIIASSFALTVTEGMIAGGFDNLAVPMLMAMLLSAI